MDNSSPPIQIQPQFAPPYTAVNGQSIDWGLNGLIAYVSGACIHLSHPVNNKLEHVGSIEVNPYQISCIKFHPNQPLIAVGDVKGRLFIWDFEKTQYIAAAKPLKKQNDYCFSIQWHEGIMLVLLKNKKLVAVSHTKGVNSDNLRNLKILWEINLPNEYTKIRIDPYFNQFYLLYGKKSFSIYRSDAAAEAPSLLSYDIAIDAFGEIFDAQWSNHFPNFIFLLMKRSIYLYSIDNSTITPVIEDNPDSLSFLVQISSDHSKLMAITNNGGITIFKMYDDCSYRTEFNFQPKSSSGFISSATNSPIKDNLIAFFHSTLGLALFDLEKLRVIAMDLIFPSAITAFDSDATRYVIGTKDGYIIIGSLFDTSETKRFHVSEDSISFVSYDAPLYSIYWQTSKNLGLIDVAMRKVSRYPSRISNFVRCFGSHRGAFIVMHDSNIIGVFVNGREKPLIFDDEIADIYVFPEATQSTGSFTVLLTRHTILFYKYDKTKVYCVSQGIKPRAVESKAVCFAQNSEEYVTGFASGFLLFYNIEKQQIRTLLVNGGNLRSLQYSIDNTSLFGLCKEDTLFNANEKNEIRFCNFGVRSFKVINETLLLVHAYDGIVKFVRIYDWKPLSYLSKFMPPPTSDQVLSYFITHQKEEIYFSTAAKDAWLCIFETIPMRMNSLYGIGKKGYFESILYSYNEKIANASPELIRNKIVSLLFLKRYEEASHLAIEPNVDDPKYFNSAVFSALIIASEDKLNERARLHLKSTAMNLISARKFDDAAILLRLSGYDVEAAESFLEFSQFDIATKFLRNTIDDENEKNDLLFKFGCKYFELGKIENAIPYFAGAGQYHPVLFILFSMGYVVDAYFIMKHLNEKNQLKPVDSRLLNLLPGLQEFNEMCEMIEQQFNSIVEKLKISL